MKATPIIDRRQVLLGFAATLAAAGLPRAAQGSEVRWWRAYWETTAGQIHVHNAAPQGSGAQRTPLVCFHPTAYSGNFFKEFQALVATDRWVMCPDTPGFGGSFKPQQPPTMRSYAEAMAEMLELMGFGSEGSGPVDLLGFHTGCFIATEIAALRPDLVRRMVLPGIPFQTGEARHKALEANAKPKPLYSDPEELTRMWEQRWEWQGEAVGLPRLLELLGEELRSGPTSWWAYRAVFTYEAEQRLPLIKTPTLAVATGGDLFEPTKAAAALVPNAQVEEHPDREAPLFNLHYELMAEVTRRFLDARL